MTTDFRVRRIYADPQPDDGARVLVDRIWPRGLRKDAARLDVWAKDAAPSTELRGWYGHDPAKFSEFRRRYTAELTAPAARAELDKLRELAASGPVTLLTATKETDLSQAAVLAELLTASSRHGGRPAAGAALQGSQEAEGGETACWAHLVCPECGAMTSEGHREGCSAAVG